MARRCGGFGSCAAPAHAHIGRMEQTERYDGPHDGPDDLPAAAAPEIAALAARWKRANGPVIKALNRLGGRLEDQVALLPGGARARIDAVVTRALEAAYELAARGGKFTGAGERGTMAAAIATGAAGGAGGLASAIAELPFTIAVLLHAIRREAEAQGFNPDDPWIMAEALRTFGSGSPADGDDGIDTTFFSARLALNGAALQKLVGSVAPKLATGLSQKLVAQAVPIIGAVSGAALNAAFLRYYREMAAIRFRLLRLSEDYGAGPVLAAYAKATATPKAIGAEAR